MGRERRRSLATAPDRSASVGMSPARLARLQAGLSVREASRRTRYCEEAIRLAERGGGRASYRLATTLAKLYKCSANVFLYSGGDTPAVNNTSLTTARAR